MTPSAPDLEIISMSFSTSPALIFTRIGILFAVLCLINSTTNAKSVDLCISNRLLISVGFRLIMAIFAESKFWGDF